MAVKEMYRSLMIETGEIKLMEYDFYSGQVVLDVIPVEYDDTLTEENREMLVKALEENIEKKQKKHMAEMFKLEKLRDSLLLLDNKAPLDGEFIPKGE